MKVGEVTWKTGWRQEGKISRVLFLTPWWPPLIKGADEVRKARWLAANRPVIAARPDISANAVILDENGLQYSVESLSVMINLRAKRGLQPLHPAVSPVPSRAFILTAFRNGEVHHR